MCHLFNIIEFPDHNNDFLQKQLASGRSIYIPKYGLELGDYRKHNIVETVWRDYLIVLDSEINQTISTTRHSVLTKMEKTTYRSYDTFDLLTLSKINGIVFFIPYNSRIHANNFYNDPYYFDIGIIFEKKVYRHHGLGSIYINNLEDICEELKRQRSLYLPLSINRNRLRECLHQDMTPIEFVLRCGGYSRRTITNLFSSDTTSLNDIHLCITDYYDGSRSGQYYFKSIRDVYYFLKRGV